MTVQFPQSDNKLSIAYGIRFAVYCGERSHPKQKTAADVPTLAAAMEIANQIDAGAQEADVYTTDGFQYWSSRDPEFFNSTVIAQGRPEHVMLGSFRINWFADLLVKNSRKASKVLGRIEEALGQSYTIVACEPHFREESLYRAQFYVDLDSNDIGEAVFQTLMLAGRLASPWEVAPPHEYQGRWEFDGWGTRTSVSGLHFIQFRLANFETNWRKNACNSA